MPYYSVCCAHIIFSCSKAKWLTCILSSLPAALMSTPWPELVIEDILRPLKTVQVLVVLLRTFFVATFGDFICGNDSG